MKYKELCVLIADAVEIIDGYDGFLNNPGRLWDGNNKRIFKKIEINSDGFLIFSNYKEGRKAFEKDILLAVLAGKTLQQYLNYQNQNLEKIEEKTNIKRNQKLSELIT